jgi:hypothetical protein
VEIYRESGGYPRVSPDSSGIERIATATLRGDVRFPGLRAGTVACREMLCGDPPSVFFRHGDATLYVNMKKPLLCWRCGAAIKPEQRPISRLERCRACQADLHVCRLCRHYTVRMTGFCDHDHAEPPRERERANFCQYFKPRPGAFASGEAVIDQCARDGLEALFGKTPPQPTTPARLRPEADRAREELARLFGETPADAGQGDPDG